LGTEWSARPAPTQRIRGQIGFADWLRSLSKFRPAATNKFDTKIRNRFALQIFMTTLHGIREHGEFADAPADGGSDGSCTSNASRACYTSTAERRANPVTKISNPIRPIDVVDACPADNVACRGIENAQWKLGLVAPGLFAITCPLLSVKPRV
jgi:hypothetical protein